MIKFFTVLFFAVFFTVNAQTTAPKFINYQGIARDASGSPITTPFDIRFTISNSVTNVHNEIQTGIQPNQFGLFTTQIGLATPLTISSLNNGPYNLSVSIKSGSSFTLVGTQQLVSVPFSLFADDVPTSYTNNILTIGASSYSISTGTAAVTPTINGTGLATVSPNTGPVYTVDVPTPTLSFTSTGNILTITQGTATSSVPLTGVGSSTISMSAAGIASVNPTSGSAFTVTVPNPSISIAGNVLTLIQGSVNSSVTFNPALNGDVTGGLATTTVSALHGFPLSSASPTNSQVLTFVSGSWVPANPPALPTLSISGSTLTSGPATNSVNILNAGDVIGPISTTTVSALRNTPIATTAPSNNQLLTFISGSWTPANPPGPPVLSLTGTTLTSGAASNSVNLASIGPWVKSGGTVTLSTITDNVGIGLNSPAAKLDAVGTATSNTPIIKATNVNSSNTQPVILASSNGGNAINASETSAAGANAAQFSSTNGVAVFATSSATNATSNAIQAVSSSAFVNNYAGFFDGGLVAKGKTSSASGNALTVKNSSGNDIMDVRNDGNVSIGAIPFTTKLNVAGQVTIVDGQQADGKVLVSNGGGTGTWRSSPPAQVFGNLNVTGAIVNSSGTALNTPSMGFTKVYASSEIQIDLYSQALSGNFSGGATDIYFQIRVDGNTSAISTIHHIFSTNTIEYISLKAVFQGLSVGSHTITIWGATNAGTSSNVYIDPGGWGGTVILKETY